MTEAILTLHKGYRCLVEMSFSGQWHPILLEHHGPVIFPKKDLDDYYKVTKFLSYKVCHLLLPFFLKIMCI